MKKDSATIAHREVVEIVEYGIKLLRLNGLLLGRIDGLDRDVGGPQFGVSGD